MRIRNLTTEDYHIDLGNSTTPDDTNYVDQVTVRKLARDVEIPPARLLFARARLESLFLAHKLQLTYEDPFDPLVWRDVGKISKFSGQGFRLIPREYDLTIVQSKGVAVGTFDTFNFVDGTVTDGGDGVAIIDVNSNYTRTVVTTGTYLVQLRDDIVAVRAVAPVTIQLPSPVSARPLIIQDELLNSDQFLITIDPGAASIGGLSLWYLNNPGASLQLYGDGTDWQVR